jgi:hypothetical protein
VSINELVRSVDLALGGCQSDLAPRLVLTNVSLTSFAAKLDADVVEGRMSLALDVDWSGDEASDRLVFGIRQPNEWRNRLELVKNGVYLRLIAADSSGREVDVSVSIASWRPGVHNVTAMWGQGHTALAIEGTLVGDSTLGDILLAAGSDLLIGGDLPGSTLSQLGGSVRQVAFAAGPP